VRFIASCGKLIKSLTENWEEISEMRRNERPSGLKPTFLLRHFRPD